MGAAREEYAAGIADSIDWLAGVAEFRGPVVGVEAPPTGAHALRAFYAQAALAGHAVVTAFWY